MATLTTKFSLGDQVWKIYCDRETIKLPCRDCLGTGWVRAQLAGDRTEKVRCPRHTSGNGMATVHLGTWPEWRVGAPLVIGMIQLRVVDRSRHKEDSHRPLTNRDPDRVMAEDAENYMAWESGIGTGTIHYAEDLFGTPEEAEEEAERRTALARAGEQSGGRRGRGRVWWPTVEQIRIAAGFLDHRDIYEHDGGHVALAEAIIAVAAKRERAQ